MKVYKAAVKKFFPRPCALGDFLLKLTPLALDDLADVAAKGGVWIQREAKGKILRIRSLKETVDPPDVVTVNYDPKVLRLPEVSRLECLYEDRRYGVWVKPAGVVPQGSQMSDHASVIRYVEKRKDKEVYLVHRLDRETQGLMIVAYDPAAAALLSSLFTHHQIVKKYLAVVKGEMPVGEKSTIDASLDDKEAVTHLEVIDSRDGQSLLRVKIDTGRLHQIRRHLDSVGHPVMGDPRYGHGNKNREGLQLFAYHLSFRDPFSNTEKTFELKDLASKISLGP